MIIALAAMMLSLVSCGSSKNTRPVEEPSVGVSLDGDKPIIMRRGLNGLEQGKEADPVMARQDQPIVGSAPMAMPKGLLYKTSGDYDNNVPVQMGAGGELISFPAPTDIPANPEPLRLAYGWLLSPVGVTVNSVFTRWTYAEYRALPQPPTPDEIRAAVIPGGKVTMTMQLPMTQSEALADTTAVNEFIMANQVIVAPTR